PEPAGCRLAWHRGPGRGGASLDAGTMTPRLLAGPPAATGPETLADHLARLGRAPTGSATRGFIPVIEASGLLGRGGAGFPVGRKWRTLAERPAGPATVLVNAAE